MTLTAEQVREIEASASRYGCGADICLDCYPLEYRCVYCEEEFEVPILNGQQVYCDTCDDYTNADWEPNEEQIAFYTQHGQKSREER
jgi:Zn finger protein HypA/HybF involved in hydrogenase expression